MKKRFFAGLAVFAVIGAALAVVMYHSTGWFRGDPLEYVKANCCPDHQTILSGEHLATGIDDQGGFIIYQVTTEDGGTHYVRIHVVFHRYLTRIGPDFKIRGVTELEHYERLEVRE